MQSITDLIREMSTLSSFEATVLGLEGSPRKGGNSHIILQHIIKGVTDSGIPAHGGHLRDIRFEGCIGCERCRRDMICTGLIDGMTYLYEPFIKARGLVLVCPTHNYNVTSWMKAFIDRLYCFYNFDKERPGPWSSRLSGQGRKVVLAAVCEQEVEEDMGFTLEGMRRPMEALGYDIVAELPVLGVFHKARVKEKQEALARAVEVGRNLARALQV